MGIVELYVDIDFLNSKPEKGFKAILHYDSGPYRL